MACAGFFDKHLRGIDNDFPAGVYQKYRDWVTSYDNSAVRERWLSKSQQERAALEEEIACSGEGEVAVNSRLS